MGSQQTLNDAAPSTADVMVASSTISTNAEDLAPQEASIPEEKEQVATEAKAEEAQAEEIIEKKEEVQEKKEEPIEDRFDKHPRFQELISEKNALKSQVAQVTKAFEQLAAEMNSMKAWREPDVPVEQELAELFEVDQPKALARMLEIAEQRAEQKVLGKLQENSTYNNLSTALKSYQDANPDFVQRWEDGTLEKVMQENPLYNTPIAAYQYLSFQEKVKAFETTMQAEIAKAVEAARKEERDAADKKIKEIEANHKAKKESTVVTERTSASSSTTKSNTDTGGDKVSWLVKRMKEREAAG